MAIPRRRPPAVGAELRLLVLRNRSQVVPALRAERPAVLGVEHHRVPQRAPCQTRHDEGRRQGYFRPVEKTDTDRPSDAQPDRCVLKPLEALSLAYDALAPHHESLPPAQSAAGVAPQPLAFHATRPPRLCENFACSH